MRRSIPTAAACTSPRSRRPRSRSGATSTSSRGAWRPRGPSPGCRRPCVALAARLGLATPYGGTQDLPIEDRFYAGGANTVRGYREQRVGPLDANGDPIGGNALVVLNAEWRFPIWRVLGGAVFVDAGAVTSEVRQLAVNDVPRGGGRRPAPQHAGGPAAVRLRLRAHADPRRGSLPGLLRPREPVLMCGVRFAPLVAAPLPGVRRPGRGGARRRRGGHRRLHRRERERHRAGPRAGAVRLHAVGGAHPTRRTSTATAPPSSPCSRRAAWGSGRRCPSWTRPGRSSRRRWGGAAALRAWLEATTIDVAWARRALEAHLRWHTWKTLHEGLTIETPGAKPETPAPALPSDLVARNLLGQRQTVPVPFPMPRD